MTSVLDHIGGTPLVRLEHIGRDLPVPVLVKCEHMNPGGSIKDRIALAIVDDAERRGLLRRGMTLIEGGSAGANLVAALRVAARGDLPGPVITVMCDSWDRYRAKPWMQNWEHA
jgi:cysteine synthase